MRRITRLFLTLAAVLLPLVSYAQWQNDDYVEDGDAERPIVLCRSFGCTEVSNRMTRSHLFNSISSIFYINDQTKVHMCEADPYLRACKTNGIRYGLSVGDTPGVAYIPSFSISEVSFSKNLNRINFITTYDIQVNGVRVFCSGARNTINVTSNKQAMIRDNNYRCQLTSDIPAIAYSIYNIDYIDLDYGIIGAYYSTGISGSSVGGGDGYVLMRFQNAPGANTHGTASGSAASCPKNDRQCSENFSLPDGQYEVLPLREGARPAAASTPTPAR